MILSKSNKYLLYCSEKDSLYFDLEKNSIENSDSASSIPLRILLQQTADKLKRILEKIILLNLYLEL